LAVQGLVETGDRREFRNQLRVEESGHGQIF
jgi:hypothetical protein